VSLPRRLAPGSPRPEGVQWGGLEVWDPETPRVLYALGGPGESALLGAHVCDFGDGMRLMTAHEGEGGEGTVLRAWDLASPGDEGGKELDDRSMSMSVSVSMSRAA
jgi:hypothetical protein